MRLFLIFFSLIITSFAQPAWIRSFSICAAAFGYACFWKGMLSFHRRRDRFLLSCIWFACVQGVQLSWMMTVDYMGPLIIVFYLFLILAMGVQFGILSLFLDRSLHFLQILAIGGCWVIFEWVRLFFLCGFTWNQVGMALTSFESSLQFASIWGIFGLSFWVIIVNLLALRVLLSRSGKQFLVWALIAFVPYLFGFLQKRWIEANIEESGRLKVALVQTGLLPEKKDFFKDAPNAYIPPLVQWKRVLEVLDEKRQVDLIVFPEAAFPLGAHVAGYDLDSVSELFETVFFPPLVKPYAVFNKGKWRVSNAFLVQTLANKMNAHVIIGLDDRDRFGKYNAAFHFIPNQSFYERYVKQILVPAGEYIPMQQFHKFSQFMAKHFGIHSSFSPGFESTVFKAQYPIGISICLEETFSYLIRKFRLKGAQIFVNVTNDSWFPRSKLARQHYEHGRIRAVENGVPILRACNTGITGGIDCFGRAIELLSPSEVEASSLYLTLPIRSYATFYTLWGDKGILSISFFSIFAYLLFLKKKLL